MKITVNLFEYKGTGRNTRLVENKEYKKMLNQYKLIERGNNAPRGGKIGEYAIFDNSKKFEPKSSNFAKANELMLPLKLLRILEKWTIINKSPYSNSFYNSDNISWDSKPEGSLRLSDHWNFETMFDNEKHCKLAEKNEYIKNNWILAIRKNGVYNIKKELGAF